MRCVVFDLDGTLADTSADLVASANACFADLGLGPLLDPQRDAGTALRGGKAMLQLGFSRIDGPGEDDLEAEVARLYPVLLRAYGEALATHTRLYPGAMEAIDALRGAGYRTAICTNKPEALAERLMVALGARGAFDALIGADTLPVRKPDPAPFHASVARAGGGRGRACLVGDSITDRETARAAGAPSILVTFGPEGAQMPALAPDFLIADYTELFAVVEALRL